MTPADSISPDPIVQASYWKAQCDEARRIAFSMSALNCARKRPEPLWHSIVATLGFAACVIAVPFIFAIIGG